MLVISLVSFAAIILAWIVAPEGAPAHETRPAAIPNNAVAARA
jgi:hypothetical protein